MAILKSKRVEPTADSFRLADWPFYHMNLAVRAYDTEMKRLLRPQGLDVARWRILLIVNERQPISVTEVANQVIMEPSTVTRAMQRLQNDGLLKIGTRFSDQRVSEATLTPKGVQATDKVRAAAARVFADAFADFKDKEIETLISLLQRAHSRLRTPIP